MNIGRKYDFRLFVRKKRIIFIRKSRCLSPQKRWKSLHLSYPGSKSGHYGFPSSSVVRVGVGAQWCIDLLLAVSDRVNCTPVNQRHLSFKKSQLCFSFPFWGLRYLSWRNFWVVAVAWLWFLGLGMSGIGALCGMTVTLVQFFHIGSKGSFSSNGKDQALPA